VNGERASPSDCPPRDDLLRLLANQLSEPEEQALEDHLVGCASCRQQLDDLTGFANTLHTLRPEQAGDREAGDRAIGEQQDPVRLGGILARLANSSRIGLLPLDPSIPAKKLTPASPNRSSTASSIASTARFLRRHVWTWPLIAAALLSAAGWWVSRTLEHAMREQRINELNTILKSDVAALRVWMDAQAATAELVAADEQLRPLAAELAALADGTPDAPRQLVRAQAQTAIRSRLEVPITRGKFTGFGICSPAGVVLADSSDAPIGAALAGYRQQFITRVVTGGSAISKPFTSPLMQADAQGELRAGLPSMVAAAPIKGDDGQTIAVLGLRIRPENQFTEILHAARSGKTGETYAFDREGVLLSESRFNDDLKKVGLLVDRPDSQSILNVEVRDPGVNLVAGQRALIRRSDQELTRMAKSAVQGRTDHDVEGYRDYRGVMVVGAWKWLDEYDFGVATEVDAAEAFAPVYALRRAFALLMGLLTAAAIGIMLAMLLIARQQRDLAGAALAAQQFGQYTLVEKLGTGGMGTVYKARHALLRRPTAVKLLNPELISDAAIARFEREVQLTSGLSHPNTVAIYDYGRTPGGTFYYAMEYLDGVNLDDLVKKYGPLPEARTVYILRQVCASLAEAHTVGLVHRDIKPANIVLTFRVGMHDFVKVLDFGLARHTDIRREECVTSADVVAGTPLYLSPEAVTRPHQIDARTDVYAIGAVAYFLLTGSPVFVGASAAEICLMHVSREPVPPSQRTQRPLSPALEALVLRCLAKSPEDRPEDAAELLLLLEGCQVSGRWTAADASHWWATRDQVHSAATKAPSGTQRSGEVAPAGNSPSHPVSMPS
jgi:hypothetical protein